MQYTIVSHGDEANIMIFEPGDERFPLVAHSDHPNYDAIFEGVLTGAAKADQLVDLFDVSQAVARSFERLSERITVHGGHVYLDGDEVHSTLTEHILRFLDGGVPFGPLVNFFEKVSQNPQEHSREQLYGWLDRHAFTITPDGDIVGYKGVRGAEHGGYESISSGPAVVNDQAVNGHVPNNPGDVVEMPRANVDHNPAQGCSTGLHVGTFEFAKSFGHGVVLEVHVNPRDVVSVPTDSNWAKVRTCRYRVIKAIDAPYSGPITHDDDFASDDEDICPDCGLEVDSLGDCDCE